MYDFRFVCAHFYMIFHINENMEYNMYSKMKILV